MPEIKNIKQLRDNLAENYSAIKSKKLPLKTAKELANTAGKILASCRVEMEYQTKMGIQKKIIFLEY